MTLHAAKGLEFEHVFIAGCEDKLMPYGLYVTQNQIMKKRNDCSM